MGASSPSLFRQRRGNDCGPAALATVAAHHGCVFDWDELCAEATLDRDGTDLLALARIAERLGLQAYGVTASYDAIEGCALPAIAHLRRRLGSGHFVVVLRWTPAHVVIADPAAGLRTLSRRAFRRRWTGYLLITRPAPSASGDNALHEVAARTRRAG